MSHPVSRVSRFFVLFGCLVLTGAAGVTAEEEVPAAPEASEYDQWLAAIDATPAAAFEAVRSRVAFRPYSGRIKGPAGAFEDGTANAVDASALLAAALVAKGIPCRLMRGRLSPECTAALIAEALPAGSVPKEVQNELPEDEAARKKQDLELRRAVMDHSWVQAKKGADWIDLDPVYPGAVAGKAYGTAGKPDNRPPQPRLFRLDVHTMGEGGKPVRTVLHFQKPVQALLGVRISLLLEGLAPKARTDKPAPGQLRPVLVVGDKLLRGKAFSGRPGGRGPGGRLGGVFGPAKDKPLEAVWVKLSLSGGGLPPRQERRYLYIAGDNGLDRLDDLTSYCVTFGAPSKDTIQALAESASKCAEETKGLVFSGDKPLSEEETKKAHRMLCGALDATGAAACWLADQTHRLLEQLDAAFGTVTDYDDARVIGVSFDARRKRVSSDLVFDSVACWARPGSKASSVSALRCARGRLAGEIEGAALAKLLSGKEGPAPATITTGKVFAAAGKTDNPPVVISKENKAGLGKLSVKGATKRILLERIDAGRVVVIPEKYVDLEGSKVIAWYEIDKKTGEWIAVSADGRHQGMVNYKELYEEVVFATGICLTYIISFSGQMYFFAGSMVRNIETPLMSYKDVLDGALTESQGTTVEFGRLPQAFGDFMGNLGSPHKIPLAIFAGQVALQGGIVAAGDFIRKNFYR